MLLASRLVALQSIFAFFYYFANVFTLIFPSRFFAFFFFTSAMIILICINVYLTIMVATKWINDYYEIRSDGVVHWYGVFYKKEEIFSCKHIETISGSQDFFGTIFNYGSVRMYDPFLKKEIYLRNISNPKRNLEILNKAFMREKPGEKDEQFVIRGGRTTRRG